MKELGKTHLVVAPDLRGFGDSARPDSGYDKKAMAQDIRALAQSLGMRKAGLAGHDIGLVEYAYAAQFPSEVDRLALMDASSPASVTRPGVPSERPLALPLLWSESRWRS